ncbi:DNA (cytosine-5)-methyltransferase 1 [Jiangella sp. DSM 45060]|nr:DNA (cytosine-5)-methyltransferase 1 [Jiangella sp. DSM 45060]
MQSTTLDLRRHIAQLLGQPIVPPLAVLVPTAGYNLTVTDLFAGAGGSSTGMIAVPGIRVVEAANHWKLALDVHNANHPHTVHKHVDLHEDDPRNFARTDILWASPECTKWSQAAGAAARPAIEEGLFEDPLSDDAATRSRLLMFDVLRFAEHHRYRAMVIENVVDIATQAKYRNAWRIWRHDLANLGYQFKVVSLNSMHAQALGSPAPQSRDRLYVVCWRKGERAPDIDRFMRSQAYCPPCDAIVESQQAWKPGRNVGRYRAQYVYVHAACGTTVEPGWLPAAAAIDWSIQGQRIGDRDKPLADKTRARIAAGIAKYWLPFIAEAAGNTYERRPGVRTWSVDDVLRTLHTTASKALVVPVEGRDGKDARIAGDPLRTMTTRAETALALMPFIAELRGGGSTARPTGDPMATVTAAGNHHALITRHYGIDGGDPARHTTIPDEVLRTLAANAGNMSLLAPYYSNGQAREIVEALSTITTVDRHALVTPAGGSWNDDARPTAEAMRALTTRDAYALVMRNNGSRGDGGEHMTPPSEVLRTLTTAGHQSVITQDSGARPTSGDIERAEAMVDDCMFRMLEPHEVAAGMAFPENYRWEGNRRERVRMAGNAVTPPAARDLMAAVAAAITGEDMDTPRPAPRALRPQTQLGKPGPALGL